MKLMMSAIRGVGYQFYETNTKSKEGVK
jgi:hypothetical protein